MNAILYTPLAFWQCIALWELAMFVVGFAYGAIMGDSQYHRWWVRGIAAGVIFAFFYVAVPLIEWDERRTRR